ncbi:hypothetical protein MAR_035089 [Mya arenaria]|uniref:C1q domain-containing protein n=1 Tax=Mya arenaria TaxID=6604 RepID=A0ABY7EN07_MYAAR|nr:hypothetical protein MAR_035089 [Mya arenaria]
MVAKAAIATGSKNSYSVLNGLFLEMMLECRSLARLGQLNYNMIWLLLSAAVVSLAWALQTYKPRTKYLSNESPYQTGAGAVVGEGVGGSCQDVQEVAFTAALTQHLNLTNAEKVKYDTVFTNAGAGFDSSTGVFNCPTSGIYVFQVYVKAVHPDYGYPTELYGQQDDVYSTFTGYLLAPLINDAPVVGK